MACRRSGIGSLAAESVAFCAMLTVTPERSHVKKCDN